MNKFMSWIWVPKGLTLIEMVIGEQDKLIFKKG